MKNSIIEVVLRTAIRLAGEVLLAAWLPSPWCKLPVNWTADQPNFKTCEVLFAYQMQAKRYILGLEFGHSFLQLKEQSLTEAIKC